MTARYTLTWRSSALKDLKRLDRQAAARILPAIAALVDDPRPPGVKRVKGGTGNSSRTGLEVVVKSHGL